MPPPGGTPPLHPPPDGGWGWVVVGAAFISIGFSYAFPKAVTVFFKEIQLIFNTTYSEIAWISSTMLAVMYAGGPISSVLVNKYGSRPVVMVGGLLCCLGMVSASYSTNVVELYLTMGFICGLGLAFNLQPALTIVGKYFYKKRPVANGLAMAGSPVFLSTLAPFNQFLFNTYGWKGSFMILGGLLLNCCVAGALMRPVEPKASTESKNKYFFSFAVMFTGICHLLCPLAEDYTSLVVYAVFFGLGFGSVSSVLFETLMDLVGAQRFSSAVGLVTVVECCPVLLGPPLAGKLVDETGQYKYMYLACGAIVVLASVWLLIGNAINYRLLAREKKKNIHTKESQETEPLKTSQSPNVNIKSGETETWKGTEVNPSERETNI